MRQIQQVLLLWGILLALILLVGCGSTRSITSTTSLPTVTPTKLLSTTRTGSVTLHTDRSFYLSGETISVTVSNQSNQTIYFPDHLTNCTVVLLQRQKAQPQASDQAQTGIDPCTRLIATQMHSLASGQQLTVQLVAPKNGWPTGLFLAMLNYDASPTANVPTTLSSPAFTIGPLGLSS